MPLLLMFAGLLLRLDRFCFVSAIYLAVFDFAAIYRRNFGMGSVSRLAGLCYTYYDWPK